MFDFFRNKYNVTFSITYFGHTGMEQGESVEVRADSEEEALVKAEEIVRNRYKGVEIHSVYINNKKTYLVR